MRSAPASRIAGWDVGGAHLKLALLNAAGEIVGVGQAACPLWKGLDYLHDAVAELTADRDLRGCRHALTMTGELVDCFSGREQGVAAIVAAMCRHYGAENIDVFAGLRGFVPAGRVSSADCMDIASANWLASVMLAAKQVPDALFVDIGSTTTDIVLIERSQPRIQGFTDYQRLVSGELVYTGVVRTPVMAVAQQAEFNGRQMGLMAELFATMADVYRLTGDLNAVHDQSETADGAEKTALASARRLSRLTGYEFDAADWPLWLAFAAYLKHSQQQKLGEACRKILNSAKQPQGCVLLGAGVGRFLIKQLAADWGLVYRDFNELLPSAVDDAEIDAGDCAPAAAVAHLRQVMNPNPNPL
ncbi:hydantoinase/oxoprolinase family protein [Methylomonas koyamae]|uniref:hydantoinase/oxoprolinase family protein n=1 Tax=Methylomonas koyamae TaxID=702114 RepID=UPI001128DD3D|nr:hydantoinase/oxoprolinase family protein [Methylomonas koyamae]TPQ25521.1 H4MPT-linked C1 transfer pathway protein [Methylomonas koyamae]